MRHLLLHSWKDPTPEPGWSVDAAPRARLWMLYGVFALPVLMVALRLVWLQVIIPDRFLSAWNQTTESFESIPASDGRILSSDGQVLAFDQPRHSIQVHYRWIEVPVNTDWLKARARERVPRAERKNPERMAAAEASVQRDREELWQSLSLVTGHPLEQLTKQREAIQKRVEAISHSVNTRQQFKVQEATRIDPHTTWIDRLWKELSTAPDRTSSRPIVIKEELEPHTVLEGVTVQQIAAIQSRPSRFPGVEIGASNERLYPHGLIAPHVVGLRVPVDLAQYEQRRDRFPQGDPLALELGDRTGKSGIERAYDSHLRGVRGLRRVVRNHAGEIIEQRTVRASQSGFDVTLTLDADLQQQAEQVLDDVLDGTSLTDSTVAAPDGSQDTVVPSAGAIVVLDLRNGETLIAASSPRYDLSEMQHPSREQWNRWARDSRHPFISRVTQATVPPGSIFKLVTTIAGLEQGVLSPEAPFHCQGYLHDPEHDRCSIYRQWGRGHGDITLSTAISQSCNVYFFDLAQRVGPEPIEAWARRLGFGVPTGIDIGGERAGNVPSRSSSLRHNRWYPGTTRQFAIGQADLTVTPLQVARLMAAIGNGGRLVTPRLTTIEPESPTPPSSSDSIQLTSGTQASHAGEKLLSDRTLQALRSGMELTVEHPQGTGHRAQIPGLTIAAKTGTAEVGGDQPDHAWFAGYVPADRPRYAFAVFLEHGGSGGKAAAPVARQVLMSMIEADLLSSRPDRQSP